MAANGVARRSEIWCDEGEKGRLIACLRTANEQAATEVAFIDTEVAVQRYYERRPSQTGSSAAEREAVALNLLSRSLHLGRFLNFADTTVREIIAEALQRSKVENLSDLIETLDKITGESLVAARHARADMPGPGAPVQQPALRDLVFELAQVFVASTGEKISAGKRVTLKDGNPIITRKKAGRYFIEIVLREIVNVSEPQLTEPAFVNLLREARKHIARDMTVAE